jgi:hypothetical protein
MAADLPQPAQARRLPVLSGGFLPEPAFVATKNIDGVDYIRLNKRDKVLAMFLFSRRASVRPWPESLFVLEKLKALRNAGSAFAQVDDDEDDADDGLIKLDLDQGPPKRRRASASSPIDISVRDWTLKVLPGCGNSDVEMEFAQVNFDNLLAMVQDELKAQQASALQPQAALAQEPAEASAAAAEDEAKKAAAAPSSPSGFDPETPEKCQLRGMTWVESQQRFIVRYRPVGGGPLRQKTFKGKSQKESAEAASAWVNIHLTR